jgi:hypothetical protein
MYVAAPHSSTKRKSYNTCREIVFRKDILGYAVSELKKPEFFGSPTLY